jgi:hypothetical protein
MTLPATLPPLGERARIVTPHGTYSMTCVDDDEWIIRGTRHAEGEYVASLFIDEGLWRLSRRVPDVLVRIAPMWPDLLAEAL